MAHYLVSAKPYRQHLHELQARLQADAFMNLRPFGRSLTKSLRGARLMEDGTAVWEEEDYCDPPLAQERAAVLDAFFEDLEVREVDAGKGWQQIEGLPRLFPDLSEPSRDA